jgi:hypothetical protein
MKTGDKVKIIDWSGLSGYRFYRRLKKHKTLTIRKVKASGGLLFEEITIGTNMFGEEQGVLMERCKVINKRKSANKKKK